MNPVQSNSPQITVLMSCYNANRWLSEAINSVLAQTFADFEFILVDDGSTDETLKIIKNFQAQDERIVAISKKNTGLADSLNVGIAKAKGTWICRLDADDLCEPSRLEEQINYVTHHQDVVLLGSCFFEIDEHGHVIKKQLYPTGHRRLVRHLERFQRFFAHSSAFYRVDKVKQVGGYNPRFLRAEDWRLWLDLTMQGKIACLPKPLVRIRRHADRISLDSNGRRQFCDGTAATVGHFLRKAGYEDPSLASSDSEWISFLKWVEKRVDETGAFEKRKAWGDARSAFFSSENKVIGANRFGFHLIQSGYGAALVWEKFFGSSLPERLAREWML